MDEKVGWGKCILMFEGVEPATHGPSGGGRLVNRREKITNVESLKKTELVRGNRRRGGCFSYGTKTRDKRGGGGLSGGN